MASSKANGEEDGPRIMFTSPSFTPSRQPNRLDDGSRVHRRLQRNSQQGDDEGKHVRLEPAFEASNSPPSSVYLGSYGRSPRRSRVSLGGSLQTPGGSNPATPRSSVDQKQLQSLLQDLNLELESYGLEEHRDGFFDASFFKPSKPDQDDVRETEYTMSAVYSKGGPLSLKRFLSNQWQRLKEVVHTLSTSRAGIKLTKSFLPVFIAYVLCLVPVTRLWLGKYNYIMVISTILNHSGRTIGAQLDGTILTIIGSATGLGWGAFALWLSDSTATARRGYGGILEAFLVVFMGVVGALRSYYIRLYQMVLCAGIAVIYTCLADTSNDLVWRKLLDYAIPWLCGQALALVVCCTVLPDAGARPLAVGLHRAFAMTQEGLKLPQTDNLSLHRNLAYTFVDISQIYRDLVLDISITRFRPTDVLVLRNLMQAVIRSLLSLKMESQLFDDFEAATPDNESRISTFPLPKNANKQGVNNATTEAEGGEMTDVVDEVVVNIDGPEREPPLNRKTTEQRVAKLVAEKLAEPTSALLSCMRVSLARCDAVLMDMSGYRKQLGPPQTVSTDIVGGLTKLRKSMMEYDREDDALVRNPALPPTYSDHPEAVELFLFVHPIRQAATTVENLLVKVMEMQQRHRGFGVYLPSYPLAKALQRTNAQVRHDRGGVTVGFYFRSQTQLARVMRGMANIYRPPPRQHHSQAPSVAEMEAEQIEAMGKYGEEDDIAMDHTMRVSRQQRLRYQTWMLLHRLQGFETRFALKLIIVISLLSVPAWLSQSNGWWNENESWWAVVMAWIMMHPRVGGNFQDLVTRSLFGVLGAVWGGIAYGADNGNPYIIAVFAAVYLLPLLYRYTQSPHPRSGIVGCISFVVVSLSANESNGLPSVFQIAWTRGVAFVIGVMAAVVVNWILWPFVARHELRKALSAILIYSSIIYRGVVAKYVYYDKGQEPGTEDIQRSEMLEGRLREGFVRMRQLMALTRHEIRLRAPFDPTPYAELIESCERFFEYLVAVRQSSLFSHPHYISDNEQATESLLPYRRDAVAAILMNLYVLAGALRGNRKVPVGLPMLRIIIDMIFTSTKQRYLPSAVAARKRLLDRMAEIESEQAQDRGGLSKTSLGDDLRWAQIYSYSYSQSLTGCVKQLEQLIRHTKDIVGEQGFDPIGAVDNDNIDVPQTMAGGNGQESR